MLYETFNANKESLGEDFFTSRIDNEIIQNLNPKFELREYQKEALGRFDFYFNGYQKDNFRHSFFSYGNWKRESFDNGRQYFTTLQAGLSEISYSL